MPNVSELPRPRSQRKISWDAVRVVAIYAVMIQHITHQAPINHPELGPLAFEHAVFHPSEAPEQRLVLYIASPEHDTAAKLASLLEPQAVAVT